MMTCRRPHSKGLTPAQSAHALSLPASEREAYIASCENGRPGHRRVWMGTHEDRERENERIMREHRAGRWHW